MEWRMGIGVGTENRIPFLGNRRREMRGRAIDGMDDGSGGGIGFLNAQCVCKTTPHQQILRSR